MKRLRVLLLIGILILAQVQSLVAGQIVQLSLEEASDLALVNNFDIQLAKYDTWIARENIREARSIYDVVIAADANYEKDKHKRATTILGSEIVDHNYDFSLSQKLPTGTTLSVDFDNNRNKTDSAFATSPVTYESVLGVNLVQELGQNFFGLQDRLNIKLTKIDAQNIEYISLNKIENDLAFVQKAYWDLVAAREILTIEEGMMQEANKLHELHQEKLKNGLVEKPEALASQANYQERINEVSLAQFILEEKSNVLRFALNISEDISFNPLERISTEDQEINLAPSLNKAFENRSDYKKKINEIKGRDIQVVMKKNSLWPQINLRASLSQNGLGDDWGEAAEGISQEDNTDVYAGVSVEFPVQNRKARAQLKKAELQKAQTLIELKQLERRITIDVTDDVRRCNVFKEVAQNALLIAGMHKEKLDEELKRFNSGRSETDTLIRFQEDYLQAQRRAVLTNVDYRKALVDLKKTEGSLLNQYWDEEI